VKESYENVVEDISSVPGVISNSISEDVEIIADSIDPNGHSKSFPD